MHIKHSLTFSTGLLVMDRRHDIIFSLYRKKKVIFIAAQCVSGAEFFLNVFATIDSDMIYQAWNLLHFELSLASILPIPMLPYDGQLSFFISRILRRTVVTASLLEGSNNKRVNYRDEASQRVGENLMSTCWPAKLSVCGETCWRF